MATLHTNGHRSLKDLLLKHQEKNIGEGKRFSDEPMFNEVLQQTCKHFGVPPIDTDTYAKLSPRQVTIMVGMLGLKAPQEIIILTHAARPARSNLLVKNPKADNELDDDELKEIAAKTSRTLETMEALSPRAVRQYVSHVIAGRKRTAIHYSKVESQKHGLEEGISAGTVPSFAKIIEDLYQEKLKDIEGRINLKTLFWDRLFLAWQQGDHPLSPEGLCKMVAERNQDNDGKATLTNEVIYNWKNYPERHPYPESVEILCKAFGLSLEHEVMLWKIIAGHPFKNPYKHANSKKSNNGVKMGELDAAIETAASQHNHGPLVKALVEASGIPNIRLERILGTQQLNPWKHGAHIEETATADLFVGLANPQLYAAEPEKIAAQNHRLLGMLTGRILDIPDMLEAVRTSKVQNPGGALLILLTGRKGLVPLSAETLAEAVTAKGCPVTENTVKKMRNSNYQRGCTIKEDQARAVMKIVGKKAGIELTRDTIQECVDMLTTNRIPSASVEDVGSEEGVNILHAKARFSRFGTKTR